MIITGKSSYERLSKKFDNVYESSTFNLVYENNEVNNFKTFTSSVKSLPDDLITNYKVLNHKIIDFKPDIVITDFEPYAHILKIILNKPLLAVDNLQVVTQCVYDYPKRYSNDRLITTWIMRGYTLGQDKRIITTFFYPKVKNPENTVLYPPILRKEIFECESTVDNHVLVYQTSDSNNQLIETLSQSNENFIVYGFNKEEIKDNMVFKEFNEDEFFNDLASAKAVLTNGGFTLIGESLYLKKPLYCQPIKGQFEQILNGVYIEKLGYGELHDELNIDLFNNFMSNLSVYGENLKSYETVGNNNAILKEIKDSIEELVDNSKKRFLF